MAGKQDSTSPPKHVLGGEDTAAQNLNGRPPRFGQALSVHRPETCGVGDNDGVAGPKHFGVLSTRQPLVEAIRTLVRPS